MILEGVTSGGAVVPVEVTAQGRLVAEGLTGPAGPAGPEGPAGPTGPAGSGAFDEIGDAAVFGPIWFDGTGSTPLVRDSSGRLLVGTSSALGDSNSRFNVVNTGPADIYIGRSDGYADADSRIGQIVFQSFAGSSWQTIANIQAIADGASGANDKPGRLVFSVTPDTKASPEEAMRIKNTKIINFANAPVYADNAAAKAGGLVAGDVYKKADGTLMITF